MIQEAQKALNNIFGYESFRPLQEEAIKQVLQKKDALVIMPTGGGKSLCYQIPAVVFNGLTIVISPLISLMKDQVEQLQQFDIPALFLNSSLTAEQYRNNVAKLQRGEARLLYLAPETLLMPKTRELLSGLDVDCFTIDEAHCISEWGHDFRPEYRQLTEVRKDFPDAACLALTATATPRVQKDIKETLGLKDSQSFIASFDRKNLLLKVADKENPLEQVLDFIYTRTNQSGIIYCFSRRQVDELYVNLKQEGYKAKPYHAGLPEKVRTSNQDAFIRDDIDIIVATIAFGMGINKPDVRYVIHYDMPKNIEAYYQQIGRAGRDSLRADCLVLFSYADTQKIRYFINKKEGREKQVAEQHLKSLLKFLECQGCRRKPLMSYFGETYENDRCDMCDNCLSVDAEVQDLTEPAQKFLSCVVRTDQTFGSNYISDVLRGSKSKKVLENSHNQLSTYGIGKEWKREHWVHLSRLLVRQNYLQKAEYGSLKLGEHAEDVLKGREKVYGLLDRTSTVIDEKAALRTSDDVEHKHDTALFEQLRKKRKELADDNAIPPYTIFPDTTLMEMAYYFPKSSESLLNIYGVGSAKEKRYGKTFLKIIKTYCDGNSIGERRKRSKAKTSTNGGGKKFEVVSKAFNDGQSIEHIAEEQGVKSVTVLNHLKTFLEEGNSLRSEGIVEASSLSARKRDEVLHSFKKVGPDLLKPVYEDLNKSVGYNELRILQLYYQAQTKN